MKNVFLSLGICAFILSSCTTDSDFAPDENSELKAIKASAGSNLVVNGDSDGNRGDKYVNGGSKFATAWLVDGGSTMSFPSENEYLMTWGSTKNYVGGKGWKINDNGDSNYNINKTIKYKLRGKTGRVDFAGVYGWTASPPVEYYVVEKGSHFIGDGDYEYTNTYWANGSYYDFYKKRTGNWPAAVCPDNCFFWQYVSVRRNQPTWWMANENNIDMSKHVEQWRWNGYTNWGTNNRLGTPAAYQVFGAETRPNNGQSVSGSLRANVR